MIRKLFPIILALIGLGGGVGAGIALRPAPAVEEAVAEDGAKPAEEQATAEGEEVAPPEYVKLNNQFVVPVLEDGRVASMVIMSLNLEVAAGTNEQVYAREPKLRDAFLQVMFDHANSGGFNGSFTDGSNLILLRKALLEAAQSAIGEIVTDVLISDIVRQDG
jgi:flagellar basal body-associated protein FliL